MSIFWSRGSSARRSLTRQRSSSEPVKIAIRPAVQGFPQLLRGPVFNPDRLCHSGLRGILRQRFLRKFLGPERSRSPYCIPHPRLEPGSKGRNSYHWLRCSGIELANNAGIFQVTKRPESWVTKLSASRVPAHSLIECLVREKRLVKHCRLRLLSARYPVHGGIKAREVERRCRIFAPSRALCLGLKSLVSGIA